MVTNICPYKDSICDVCYENGRNIPVLQLNQKMLMANIEYARSAGLCFCIDQSELPDDIRCDLKDAFGKEVLNFEERHDSIVNDITSILSNSPSGINSNYAIKMKE